MAQTKGTVTGSGQGTLIIPPGVTSVFVELFAGGGGGGGASGTKSAGGGGAGGIYVADSPVVAFGSYTYLVGAGGTAGTNVGGVGGSTWFNAAGAGGSIFSPSSPGGTNAAANNGGGGGGVSGTTGALGTLVFAGGNGVTGIGGTGGTARAGGGGGGAADTGVGGAASNATGGTGASTGGGHGGNAGGTAGAAGAIGTAFGGAGGGAFTNNTTDRAGGAGAAGGLKYTWTNPLFQNLTDNFDDNSRDVAKWNLVQVNAGTVAETNSQLEISPQANNGDSENKYESHDLFDLTASYVYVQIKSVAADTNTSSELSVNTSDYANRIRMLVQGSVLQAIKTVATVDATVGTVTFDPVNHSWWKIREAAGTTFWDTSADGTTYANFQQIVNPITITALNANIATDIFSSDANPGTTIWDNFNVTPVVSTAPPPQRNLMGVGQ